MIIFTIIFTILSDCRSVMDIKWMQVSTSALANTRPVHPGLRNHRPHHTAVGWFVKLPCGVSLFHCRVLSPVVEAKTCRSGSRSMCSTLLSPNIIEAVQNAVFNICWGLMGDVAPAPQDDVGRPHFISSMGSETYMHQARTAVKPNEKIVKELPGPY